MFMWGDRLIDGEKYKYGMWENYKNGTESAIDMIYREIIICDWHYKRMPSYPTVDMFLEKGFRVLPSSKKNEEAIESLIKHSFKLNHPRMLGHLFTTFRSTWDTLKTYPPLLKGMEVINSQKFYDVSLDLKIEEGQERVPKVVLWVNHPNAVIRYTTNGSQSVLQSPEYSAPIVVKKSMEVKALAFSENKPIGEISERKFINHKGLGSKITILSKTHRESQYLDKEKNLVDGKLGINLMADGQWVGFGGASMQVALDLGKKQSISTVSINFSTHSGNWASSPGRMEIYGSLDGNSFELLADQAAGPEIGEMDILSASFEPFDVQFVKIIVYPQLIPEGQEGGGNMGFLFIGELIVD